jgi:hypothetical protein
VAAVTTRYRAFSSPGFVVTCGTPAVQARIALSTATPETIAATPPRVAVFVRDHGGAQGTMAVRRP